MTDEIHDQNNNATKKISKDVLQMNFMKRTTIKLEREQKLQQQQKQLKESIENGKMRPPAYYPTVEHIDDDPNWTLAGIMSEWRYSVLEEQKFGRFSYNGQNKEIEKLMIFHERRRLGLADPYEGKYNTADDDQQRDDLEEGEIIDEDDGGDNIGPTPEKRFLIGDASSTRRVHGYRGGLDETNSSNARNFKEKGGNHQHHRGWTRHQGQRWPNHEQEGQRFWPNQEGQRWWPNHEQEGQCLNWTVRGKIAKCRH